MGDTLCKLKNKVESYYKIITFPQKMPFDILKKNKLKIGFDPKKYLLKQTLNFFFKKKLLIETIKQ